MKHGSSLQFVIWFSGHVFVNSVLLARNNSQNSDAKVLRGSNSGHGNGEKNEVGPEKRSFVKDNMETVRWGGEVRNTSSDVRQTPGCGKAALANGQYYLTHNGLQRSYDILLPKDYYPSSPRSLIVGFHGFDTPTSFVADAEGMGLGSLTTFPNGPILVMPRGISAPGLPAGFNGAGSSVGQGPDGETCHPTTLKYACHAPTCSTACPRCLWTSCADDVGFTLAILDVIKTALCVNPDQVYATGFSGGSQFSFELASNPRSAPHFAAVAMMGGLPHNGFLRFPGKHIAPRLLGVWSGIDVKRQDPQYPPLSNLPGRPDKSMDWTYGTEGGYYYSTAENTTKYWATNTCGTLYDDTVSWLAAKQVLTFNAAQTCEAWCSGQVIKCLWHSDLHSPMPNSAMLSWNFFQGIGNFASGVEQSYKRRSAR